MSCVSIAAVRIEKGDEEEVESCTPAGDRDIFLPAIDLRSDTDVDQVSRALMITRHSQCNEVCRWL